MKDEGPNGNTRAVAMRSGTPLRQRRSMGCRWALPLGLLLCVAYASAEDKVGAELRAWAKEQGAQVHHAPALAAAHVCTRMLLLPSLRSCACFLCIPSPHSLGMHAACGGKFGSHCLRDDALHTKHAPHKTRTCLSACLPVLSVCLSVRLSVSPACSPLPLPVPSTPTSLPLQVDKIELHMGDDGLALTAAADIAAEEVALSIPAGKK